MEPKKVLLFGVTGQVASFMADYLLEMGHYVYGVARRTSCDNTKRIKHIIDHPRFKLLSADITDATGVNRVFLEVKPDYCFNYASQSHVKVSWDEPSSGVDSIAKGCLNCLESIRQHVPKCRYFYASSSEQFGNSVDLDGYQRMTTPMTPNSPYAACKVLAHNLTRIYRESYGIFAVCGLSANQESERRGDNFVTRKITKYIGKMVAMEKRSMIAPALKLGNTKSFRDWSHPKDFIKAHWLMLQQETPKDYIISSGDAHSVEEFLTCAFSLVDRNYKDYVVIDPALYRPLEVDYLKLDSTPLRNELRWKPEIDFKQLVELMVSNDIKEAEREFIK